MNQNVYLPLKNLFKPVMFGVLSILLCFGTVLADPISSMSLGKKSLEKISVNLKTSTASSLGEVFQVIQQQSDLVFYYDEQIAMAPYHGQKSGIQSVAAILSNIAEQHDLSFTQTNHLVAVSKNIQQEPGQLVGMVQDAQGQPLAGASVYIPELGRSISTDERGRFTLSAPVGTYTLEIRYLSYATQQRSFQLRAGQTTDLVINLEDEGSAIDEVVVVGYGTQKKIHLTGAVSQVGSEVFEDRPMVNTTRGLQGALPNLNIRMIDGKPTRGAEYNVRGATSIGAGGSALVLIDGVAGDPNLLNPNDIESVTVLKDAASAAIYGARGSFGVVLITTKSAKKGTNVISYNASVTNNGRTITPNMVTNGYEWAKSFDEAFNAWNDYQAHPQKINASFPFSLAYLDELKRRNDDPSLPKIDVDPTTGEYVYYGNTDWFSELYAPNNPSTEHALSFSGSEGKMDYFLSGRYYFQKGIFRHNPDNFETYNLRAKLGSDVRSWLRLDNNMEFSQQAYHYPILNNAWNSPVWRSLTDATFPMVIMHNPDGTMSEYASASVGGFMTEKNASDTQQRLIRNTTRMRAKLIEGVLNLNGDYTFSYRNDVDQRTFIPVGYSRYPGVEAVQGENKINERVGRTYYSGANLYLDFQKDWGAHTWSGVLGANYESTKYIHRYYQRDGMINTNLPDFSLLNGQNYILQGGGYHWRTLGGFARVSYAYDDRYLAEVNARYDGSSKFPTNQQFGFFPSVSLGWNIAQEEFWTLSPSIFSDAKVRASWGSLGNGNVEPYQYLPLMSVNKLPRIINGLAPDYTQQPNVIPAGLTWETATTFNVGTDLAFFNRRLNLNFDWYIRETTNMFTGGTPLPSVFGAAVPKGNYADLETKGWELALNWRNVSPQPGGFGYSVGFVLSDHVSHITKFNNPEKLLNSYYEGMRVGDFWGFVNDGYFTSEQEIANYPVDQSFIKSSNTNQWLPGDIKFKDLNGDNRIDRGKNTLDDPGDQVVVGNSTPRYSFGLNGSADYKNFYASVFFQGVGKRDWWPGREASLFWGQYNRPYNWMPQDVADNKWSEENPDAYFPRFRGYIAQNASGSLAMTQSKYVQNVAYVRLKNLTIGYNFKSEKLKAIGVGNLSLYLNGQNLWTWTPMYKNVRTMDPELIEGSDPELSAGSGNGLLYPMLKSYTFGVKVDF